MNVIVTYLSYCALTILFIVLFLSFTLQSKSHMGTSAFLAFITKFSLVAMDMYAPLNGDAATAGQLMITYA